MYEIFFMPDLIPSQDLVQEEAAQQSSQKCIRLPCRDNDDPGIPFRDQKISIPASKTC